MQIVNFTCGPITFGKIVVFRLWITQPRSKVLIDKFVVNRFANGIENAFYTSRIYSNQMLIQFKLISIQLPNVRLGSPGYLSGLDGFTSKCPTKSYNGKASLHLASLFTSEQDGHCIDGPQISSYDWLSGGWGPNIASIFPIPRFGGVIRSRL